LPTSDVGVRYATANGFYLSVLTALIGLLAYAGAGKPLEPATCPAIALVCVFAIAICRIWGKTIEFYGKLFGGKFAVLKLLEERLPVRVYALEERELYATRKAEHLTRHEAWVPLFLGWFFGLVAAAALVGIAASLWQA
jgi:hypothetical protein